MEDPTLDPEEREALLNSCQVVQEKLSTLSKIRRERDEVLKDLKEKVSQSAVDSADFRSKMTTCPRSCC
jgi:hypothetical protein